MSAARVWIVALPGGDHAVLRCSEEAADAGEADGLWTVIGSAIPLTLAQASARAWQEVDHR